MIRTMSLQLANLDERTRTYMLEELEYDVKNGKLYLSPRLSEQGRKDYEDLLRHAIRDGGTDTTLADDLRSSGRLRASEEREKRGGGVIIARVPVTAPETLAEGEFNRFYIRGLCRRALEDGIPELVVYRAKEVTNPRPESQEKIGTRISAEDLLEDLRAHTGVDTALGLPGPNSGLSVRLL
jgi:hypothetical protein